MIAGETARVKYFNYLAKNSHKKKSTPVPFNNNIKLEDLDTSSILSNKRMTFFEWGNMVGLNIDDKAEIVLEEIEEIIIK
jgi:hypothetical protein